MYIGNMNCVSLYWYSFLLILPGPQAGSPYSMVI
jgi:hypothetical protein